MPKPDMEVLTIEIAKLQLVGGDILVFRPPAMHPEAMSNYDLDQIVKMLPAGVMIWCIPQDVEMVVMSPPKDAE